MIRRLPAYLLACACLGPAALSAQAAADEEQAVLASVRAMLDVIQTRDAASVRHLVDSTTRFTLTRPAATGVRVVVLSGDQFLAAIARPGPPAIELIRNPEIRVDGGFAAVWTEYQFLVDGKVSHCGFNGFHLAKIDGVWKVINVSDSYRQDCGVPWPSGS
jgi:hypothetical protein